MALIVGGTTVTGTQTLDATKLTGDLPAISAANLTSVPGSTASDWRNVGSYCLGLVNTYKAPNANHAASTSYRVRPTNVNADYAFTNDSYTNSGTWKCMGFANSYSYTSDNCTLWHRIS